MPTTKGLVLNGSYTTGLKGVVTQLSRPVCGGVTRWTFEDRRDAHVPKYILAMLDDRHPVILSGKVRATVDSGRRTRWSSQTVESSRTSRKVGSVQPDIPAQC